MEQGFRKVVQGAQETAFDYTHRVESRGYGGVR